MRTPRVLFILKRRPAGPYGSWSHSPDGKPLASGLSVSATQMTYALDELGIQNQLVHVVDNNCIDREVTRYKPTHVFIEAFWVVPEKFDVLRRLHPTVKFIVRNHSKSDFLSHEGGMVGWAIDYVKRGVTLACNSPEATEDFRELAATVGADPSFVVYLPNYYRLEPGRPRGLLAWLRCALAHLGLRGPARTDAPLRVGCFGAIRPLKNHLHQAMAAIGAASRLGRPLRFYVNGTRLEGRAESILNSLRGLFKRYPQHELVELPWMEHDEFVKVARTMDAVMQVSNSETFNIVAADAVAGGVPVLGSPEIPWLGLGYTADPNSVPHIMRGLLRVLRLSRDGCVQAEERADLVRYVRDAKARWARFLAVNP